AVLIGDRSSLSKALREDFSYTGTVHVLAISGLHVGLIAALFLGFFTFLRIPKRPRLILAAVFLIFYSFVAGNNPPIVRAVIMFWILILGYLMNREPDMLNSLSFAAILILAWNPKQLFSVSFQLSFVAILSIIVLTPRIDGILRIGTKRGRSFYDRLRLYILKGLSVSAAATIGTAPFIAHYFNIISPVALFANLFIIPLLFLSIMISALFLIVNACSSFLAAPVSMILDAVNNAIFSLNHLLSRLPFSHFRIGAPSFWFIVLYYLFLSSLFIMPREVLIGRFRIPKKRVYILLLFFFAVLLWSENLNPDKKLLKITFFDVGKADAIFIEFPGSSNLLVDAGTGQDEGMDIGRSVIAPYLWNNGIERIGALVVTHFHKDHVGGAVFVLENFHVSYAIDSGARPDAHNRLYDRYLEAVKRRGVRHLTVREGDELSGFGEAKIFILNPEREKDIIDSNTNSIAMKIVYKDVSILLCADITASAMERLFPYGDFLKSSVMKVPHHGGSLGDENIAEKFFLEVSPDICVTSSGGIDRVGSKPSSTMNIITHLNSNSYNTKNSGAVILTTDGYFIKVVENKQKN
ncbi:MAG: ComEC/Rec2 family competence protein, partial [Candidatus Omnitrophica bacterium]|nr:ComEC/Rec2 family competence protein [Candidatus Omnitrophota bacterium]